MNRTAFIHSFIYSAFQRSTKVDIELVMIIDTVQNDSCQYCTGNNNSTGDVLLFRGKSC